MNVKGFTSKALMSATKKMSLTYSDIVHKDVKLTRREAIQLLDLFLVSHNVLGNIFRLKNEKQGNNLQRPMIDLFEDFDGNQHSSQDVVEQEKMEKPLINLLDPFEDFKKPENDNVEELTELELRELVELERELSELRREQEKSREYTSQCFGGSCQNSGGSWRNREIRSVDGQYLTLSVSYNINFERVVEVTTGFSPLSNGLYGGGDAPPPRQDLLLPSQSAAEPPRTDPLEEGGGKECLFRPLLSLPSLFNLSLLWFIEAVKMKLNSRACMQIFISDGSKSATTMTASPVHLRAFGGQDQRNSPHPLPLPPSLSRV